MPGHTGNILVVDDDEGYLKMTERQLTSVGHTVQTASNGMEALALLEHQDFDVILLDLRMPEMDGLQFLETLKQKNHHEEVIVITGFGAIETAIKATKLGALDYLQKPVDMDVLLNMVRGVLERSHEDPIVGYIRQNFHQIQSREQVAHRCRVEPQTVSNHVKRATGQSFRDFLEFCRIHEAQRLLAETALEAKEVSARVGFASYSTFYRVFERLTGRAPREYRRYVQVARD